MSSSAVPEYPPNSVVRSSNPHERVTILRSEQGLEAADPVSVGDMFLSTVKKFPDRTAICFKESDTASDWKEISFAEYYSFILQAAKSFVKLGLKPLSPVAVIGFLTPECLFSYFGAIIAGGITIGLTITLEGTSEELIKMLNHFNVQFVLAEDSSQVERFLQIRGKVPHLKTIIQYNGDTVHKSHGLYDWAEFMRLGSEIDDSMIEERMNQQRADQCVSVVFSSGTTGHYKSTLLTHDNLTWSAKMLHAGLSPGLGFSVDRFFTCTAPYFISCLNLDLYLPLYCAATLYIGPPSSRRGVRESLPILRQVNPTLFFTQASVFKEIRSILDEERATSPQTAREFLGLQDCRVFLTAGVSVPIDLLEYYKKLDMTLIEAYGMTENAGGITVNRVQQLKIGSVGKPYPGTYVKIDNPDHQGRGEILVFGRQRFMGYMHDEEGTRAAIDDRGWFHTGDIGYIDSYGYLFFTGRLKEMIVLLNGHNVPLTCIEEMIKVEVPFLSNVVLVGDGKEYVCCLVTLKTMSDTQTGEPLDKLTPSALAQIALLGSQCTTVSEIIEQRDEAVYGAIQRGINTANDHTYDSYEHVMKFTVLEKDFSTFGGEIGGTMKLKRHAIIEKYCDQICAMYS